MAIRCKEIETSSMHEDEFINCFDLFNHTVAPGDLITVKSEDRNRVKLLIDFEFDFNVTD